MIDSVDFQCVCITLHHIALLSGITPQSQILPNWPAGQRCWMLNLCVCPLSLLQGGGASDQETFVSSFIKVSIASTVEGGGGNAGGQGAVSKSSTSILMKMVYLTCLLRRGPHGMSPCESDIQGCFRMHHLKCSSNHDLPRFLRNAIYTPHALNCMAAGRSCEEPGTHGHDLCYTGLTVSCHWCLPTSTVQLQEATLLCLLTVGCNILRERMILQPLVLLRQW